LSFDTKALRILTAYEKGKHPEWISKVEIAQPLLDAWKANRGNQSRLRKLRSDIGWAWWLFRTSLNYDVVYTGSDWVGLLFAIGQRLARRERVPHVFIDFLVNIHNRPIESTIRTFLYRLAVEGACRVLVQRSCEVGSYSRMLRVSPEKFAFVHYHPTLYNSNYTVRNEAFIFAGGDSDRDYPLLIEAVRGLRYRVVIACLRRNHFEGLDIPQNVEICKVPEAQFLELMAGARLNVVPLKWLPQHVGGEQTYLNAMTMGKATIVTDAQASDYIQSGVTGILTSAGDVKALRGAIQQLMENPEMARSMGEKAREAAKAFAPERFFETIFRISEECVNKRVSPDSHSY
jgi:glycosyltransferase involved in cell wall biosynthesis